MQPAVTTIGTTTLDIHFYADEGTLINNPRDLRRLKLLGFERGTKIVGQNTFFSFGGGAANAAVTFARQGLKPAVVSAIGTDAIGDECLANLRTEGIDTAAVQRIKGEPTATTFMVNVGRNNCVWFVSRGASSHLDLSQSVVSRIVSPWIYLTSLSHNWRVGLDRIGARSRHGLRLMWNPGSEQMSVGIMYLKRYLKSTEVFMVNLDEALELIARSGRSIRRPDPRMLLKLLHQYGCRITIITCGHDGAYLFDGKKMHYQPAKIGKQVNRTGAGDAFGSGFLTGLIKYGRIDRALKLAMYNSSSVVSMQGAQTGILKSSDARKLRV